MDAESEARESLERLIREQNYSAADLDAMVDLVFELSDLVADCVEWCHTSDREQTIRSVDAGLQELFSDEKCADLFGKGSALPNVLLQLCRGMVSDFYDPDKAMLNTLRKEKQEELREGLRTRLMVLASDS